MAAARRGVLLARKTLAGRLLTPFPAAALSSDAASVSDRLQELKEAMVRPAVTAKSAAAGAAARGAAAATLLLHPTPPACLAPCRLRLWRRQKP